MPSRSNIAVFSYAYLPFVGGAELAVKEITDRLPGRRFICFTNRFEKSLLEERLGNVRVIRVGASDLYQVSVLRKIRYMFLAWRAAEANHRQEPFEATWAIMASYGAAAALLFQLRHPRIPLLLTLQEGDSEEHILNRVGLLYPVWKLVFKCANEIQVISNFLADFARRHGARGRVSVIPNGVDLARYKATSDKRQGMERVIITTSRLVPKNGIDILIRACARLPKLKIKNWKLEILGDGPERDALESLARELGIFHQIEFKGHVPPEQIPGELGRADGFVRPSRSEGLGNSFLEAMAAGLPIIGTDVGGIKDFLKDGETGLVARSENPEDIARKIELLFRDSRLRNRIINNGKTLIREQYSWDNIAQSMDKIFSRLLEPQVTIATGIFPPDIGGPATYGAFLMDRAVHIGVKPDLVTYGNTETRQSEHVHVIPLSLPKGIRHAVYLARLTMRTGFSKQGIIYAIDSSLGAAGMARIAAALTGAKLIVRVTGDYAWEQATQRFGVQDSIRVFQTKRYEFRIEVFRRLAYGVVRSADRVIVPSEYLKKMVLGWGAKEERVTIIPNPVVVHAPLPREKTRARLKIRGKVIVSAGRFVPWKGFRELIEVFPDIRKEFPDANLVLIGDGPDRESLEAEAEKSGVGAAIGFT